MIFLGLRTSTDQLADQKRTPEAPDGKASGVLFLPSDHEGRYEEVVTLDQLRTRGINAQGYGQVAKSVMRDPALPVGAKALYAYICSYTGI